MVNRNPKPPFVSVVIPVYNASVFLEGCLQALMASSYEEFEVIVVDDNSSDGSRDIAQCFPVRLIAQAEGPRGPAFARNLGAESANGEIIFFIDADVVAHPDTMREITDTFLDYPHCDAVFGSYDEHPSQPEFLSQYKNLYHHYVHQTAQDEGSTFWSGCGAIRRDVFLQMGGFDVHRYPRPSIEDIDLGVRLRNAGHPIRVNKKAQVQHLKRWTITNLIKTDVLDRAIPWTRLILRQRNLPNDLNLQTSQRSSAVLLAICAILLLLNLNFQSLVIFPLWAAIVLFLLSSWQLDQPHLLGIDGNERRIAYGLIALSGVLAMVGNTLQLLPLSILLGLFLTIGCFLSLRSRLIKLIVLLLIFITLGAGFVILLSNNLVWTNISVIAVFSVIILLNAPLYSFFIKERGVLFALSAIPFQLLYYLYSLAAFVIGIILHAWNSVRKSD